MTYSEGKTYTKQHWPRVWTRLSYKVRIQVEGCIYEAINRQIWDQVVE